MNIETLHSSFEPILRYQKFLSESSLDRGGIDLDIRPIDAFVMRQLIGSSPKSPTVIDFSSDETKGASSVFWAANSNVEKLYVARSQSSQGKRPVWEQFAERMSREKDLALQLTALQFVEGSSDASVLARVIESSAESPPSMILHVATFEQSPGEFAQRISGILQLGYNPLFVISPFGKTGTCEALKSIAKIQEEFPHYEFALVREQSPFLAASALGLLYPKTQREVPGILRRIAQLFEGNFDYVTLLRDHLQLTVEQKRLESKYQTLLATPKEVRVVVADPEPSGFLGDPNLIPIPTPPEPLLFARVLRGCYRTLFSAAQRESFARRRAESLRGIRNRYHANVPLLYRIVLRDLRILFFGR